MTTILPVNVFISEFFKIQGFKLKINEKFQSVVLKDGCEILNNRFPDCWTVDEVINYLNFCISFRT